MEARVLNVVIVLSVVVVGIGLARTQKFGARAAAGSFQQGAIANHKVSLGEIRVRRALGDTFEPLDRRNLEEMAIFAIRDQACPQVISEVFDYRSLLDSMSLGNSWAVGAVLLGEDSLRKSRRFDLMGVGLASLHLGDSSADSLLGTIDGRKVAAELAFLRLRDSTVTYRIPLLSARTPLEYKKILLDRASASIQP